MPKENNFSFPTQYIKRSDIHCDNNPNALGDAQKCKVRTGKNKAKALFIGMCLGP